MSFNNTPLDLRMYFSSNEKIVSIQEFFEFWNSLTENEKLYYRRAILN